MEVLEQQQTENENSYLKKSDRLKFEDLDWEKIRDEKISDDDIFVLTYFADIEGQTFFYARDLMNTSSVDSSEVRAFLTVWNYQEYFHSVALRRFMRESGREVSEERDQALRERTSLRDRLTDGASIVFSKLWPRKYLALYLTWGAINEAIAMRGYLQIANQTSSPVLSELCRRIAKQEAFHFGWYYTKAKDQLTKSKATQKFVAYALSKIWTPVGVGLRSRSDFERLYGLLFQDSQRKREIITFIDSTIHQLPGLANLNLFSTYARLN